MSESNVSVSSAVPDVALESENGFGKITSIVGLPVDNYSLAGLYEKANKLAPKFSVWDDFLLQTGDGVFVLPQSFVYVRVLNTEEQVFDKEASILDPYVNVKYRDRVSTPAVGQVSSLQVISVLWSCDLSVPESFSVLRYLPDEYNLDGINNLLRAGGTYLLPIDSNILTPAQKRQEMKRSAQSSQRKRWCDSKIDEGKNTGNKSATEVSKMINVRGCGFF